MSEDWLVRRRRLPHVDVPGKPYFITGVLSGSIPASGLKEIREYQEQLDSRPTPKGLKQAEWAERLMATIWRIEQTQTCIRIH